LARLIAVEKKAADAYENILNSFKSPENDIQYPEYYGGAYLNEKGKLVLLIATSDYDEFMSAAFEMKELAGAGGERFVSFKKAAFSYAHLAELMERLGGLFQENHADKDSIWSHVIELALLDNKNRISVGIMQADEEKVERFRSEVDDSAAFEFKYTGMAAGAEGDDDLYYAGQRVNSGSIGFRAKRDNIVGFVTAGHVTSSGAPVFQAFQIGTCVDAIADFRLDAAFVKTNEICDMSNKTYKGHVITGINATPLTGATAFKVGRITGLTSGRITSANAVYLYTLHNSHTTIIRANIITADFMSRSGDSGGIVFDAQNRLIGINLAGPVNGLAGNRAVEKASTIQEVLNVSFY
jgi:streptogrisin B